MPTYDYRCDLCEKTFEIFQSMNDPKLTICPEEDCSGEVKRLIGTGAGLIFKGSGFYETDYRSDSYKKAEAKEKPSKKTEKSAPKKEKKDTNS